MGNQKRKEKTAQAGTVGLNQQSKERIQDHDANPRTFILITEQDFILNAVAWPP